MPWRTIAEKVKKNIKIIELLVALEVLYLSVILLMPFETFTLSTAYDSFAERGSENTWGYIFGVVFLFQFIGMALNKSLIRMIGLIMATGLFFAIGTMFVMADIRSTAWGTYYVFGMISCVLYVMVNIQRRTEGTR